MSDIQLKNSNMVQSPASLLIKTHCFTTDSSSGFLCFFDFKLSSSKSCPVLLGLLPNESNNNYDINDDLNVAHFQEVTTSESIKYDSDRFIDILSTIKRENIIDEQSVMELLSKYLDIYLMK